MRGGLRLGIRWAGAISDLWWSVGTAAGARAGSELRVLTYHDVPLAMQARVEAQLRYLARYWRFLSPAEFTQALEGPGVDGRALLVTFDDGFASNRRFADEVLMPLGIRAVFFVVPEFVDCSDRTAAREYIIRRIQPGRGLVDLDAGLQNMSWHDLSALVEQGHSVGAHSLTHARLSSLASDTELIREIVESGDRIAQRIGSPVEHFAFPYGEVGAFSERAMRIAAARYRVVHSGLRGSNHRVSPLAIRRDVASPADSAATVSGFLHGYADVWYAKGRSLLDNWARSAAPSIRHH